MKNTILAAAAVTLMATTAFANESNVSVDAYAEKATGTAIEYNLEFTADFAFDVAAGTSVLIGGELAFDDIATSADTTLTSYYVGVGFANAYVTAGVQDDLFVDGTGLADPASGEYSVIAGYADYAVFVGYNDVANEVTNVQAAAGLTVASVSADVAVNYDVTAEDFALAATFAVDAAGLDSVVAATYDGAFAYEVSTEYAGITGFVAGNENDFLTDVGAGYTIVVGTVTVYTDAEYNLDSEDTLLTAGATLQF